MNAKVLTLWQPWATYLAMGIKQFETRPGMTRWDGVYLIHSAKKKNLPEQKRLHEIVRERYHPELPTFENLPFGKIIGAMSIKEINSTDLTVKKIDSLEKLLGDYSPGRFAWHTENNLLFDESQWLDYKGSQGYYANFKRDPSQFF